MFKPCLLRMVGGQILLAICTLMFAGAASATGAPKLLVVGDSLSAGYGLPASQAWPVLLQDTLLRQGANWQVINASVSGETTAGGLTRFPALLKQHKPQLVVLELGANDGLRGLPVRDMQANLLQMAKLAQDSGAKVHLVGIRIPPNYGVEYTQAFEQAFRDVAKQQKLTFTPFLLAPLADDRRLFQNDQLHPTAAGQTRVATMMAQELRLLLAKKKP